MFSAEIDGGELAFRRSVLGLAHEPRRLFQTHHPALYSVSLSSSFTSRAFSRFSGPWKHSAFPVFLRDVVLHRRCEIKLLDNFGSMHVFGKLPTYPSPNLTLTITSHFKQNVRFGEGKVGSFPETCIDPTFLA